LAIKKGACASKHLRYDGVQGGIRKRKESVHQKGKKGEKNKQVYEKKRKKPFKVKREGNCTVTGGGGKKGKKTGE